MMLPKAWTAAGRLTTLSVNGISNILDNLSSPAIIITSDEHILAANIFVPKISGYTTEEIFGLDLRILFPNLIGRYNSVPDRSLSTILLTQRHERVPVTLHLHELTGVEPHYLITFEKIADTQQKLTKKQRRLNMLTNIEQLFQSVGNLDSIEDILEIGSRLLMTNAISVYISGNESPIFCKTHNWGNSSLFPKEIPPSDLQHFLKTSLWHNGQRSVVTMLHQAIRQFWIFAALGLDALAITAQSLVGFFIGSEWVSQARRVARLGSVG